MEKTVAGSRWQDQNISGCHSDIEATLSTKNQPGAPCGKAENLVGRGVIMVEAVNAIPPLGWPCIAL